MELTGGWYELNAQTTITCDPGAADCAQLLRHYLDVTGLPLAVRTEPASTGITLRLTAGDRRLGGEGYALSATSDGVRISAVSTAGLLHGIQTLRQLLPPQVFGSEPQPGLTWRIPCVEISDSPRFGWRGSLLDVGRWYLPMDYLYRYVETLAVHKMNRFHLHLTEDQGWRFEVKRHPRLTAIGAWRRESQLGHRADPRYDGTPHGGFYTHSANCVTSSPSPVVAASRSSPKSTCPDTSQRPSRRTRSWATVPAPSPWHESGESTVLS